ncbi:hypothetical protein JCGZ_06349 [Jatropha curcas]|uniref:Uncharacterized protein n=1 Tax=Jatropha curcas TaxID=180498 RepID=A0A067KNJ5_JATCU|nr:hypothetical protein JCGZ_06349 [Jatropha curcas]
MGLKRELACLSLLVLIMSQLETPCFAVGYAKFSRFKGGSLSSSPSHGQLSSAMATNPNGVFKGRNAHNKDSDDIYGAEKRKVYTGPNPLHNR